MSSEAARNRVLDAPPVFQGEVYTVAVPRWLTNLLRLVSLIFAFVTLWLSTHNWNAMPLWAKLLMCVLIPAFFFMGTHPRGWAQLSSLPIFHADDLGMYFPSTQPDRLHGADTPRWLFVPWQHIANIRTDIAMTADGRTTCAAFDVKASAEEIREFFYDGLATKQTSVPGSTPVAFYTNTPPAPSAVVAALNARKSAGVK